MLKSVIALLSVVVLAFGGHYALAEDYDLSTMTEEEMLDLRLQINEELASRKEIQEAAPEGSTIAELFPDPVLAKYVRDEVGAFSVNDVVSQEKLDSVTTVTFTNKDSGIQSLEGIWNLRGMWALVLHNQDQLTSIPDEIEKCAALEYLTISCRQIESIPDSLCNLSALRNLSLAYTSISKLPDDIGNLTNLKELDISHTFITSLPESIYSLELDKFKREGLDL